MGDRNEKKNYLEWIGMKVTRHTPEQMALEWLLKNELPGGGIRVHSNHSSAYQEVSGYIVPTLLNWGESGLACRIAEWLISVQTPYGAYSDPDRNQAFVFDTAQVLRGLLATCSLVPGTEKAARRAADWLCSEMIDNGDKGFGPRYNGALAESMHLYCLPPLVAAAELLNEPRYRDRALRCRDYYCSQSDFCSLSSLTHFLAYELEALIDLGRADLAVPTLDTLKRKQRRDGSVSAKEGVKWVCLPGLAQIAICWYKIGDKESAAAAVEWLSRHQRPSGGFLGSEGTGATYFADVELSWAAKYFLDAVNLGKVVPN